MSPRKRNPRRVAAEIIARWENTGEPVDRIRDELIGSEGGWEERDRSLVTELAYGVSRNCPALDDQLRELVHGDLKKMQHRLLAILRVGVYQLAHLDRVPDHAVVDEAVSHARDLFGQGPAGLVNAVLRKAAGMETLRPVDAFNAPAGAHAQWKRHWQEFFGEERTEELVEWFTHIPPVGLRRNLLRTESDEQWHDILRSEGVDFSPVEARPGYVYAKGVRPDSLPSFQQGLTTAHDPGASLAPEILDPQPGEQILDCCCAPGGKTALLWELGGGNLQLLGVDKVLKRNRLTRQGLKRLGHEGIEIETADLMHWEPDRLFDKVLLDAPCSGTGTAHRRPDLLVKRPPQQVSQLARLQRSLMDRAAQWVKPGGVFVYSTCSLEPLENSRRAKGFDAKWGVTFERDDLPDSVPEPWRTGEGEAATWPPRDKVDGAYAVRWRRKS
ncbi:hypothetical protein GF324_04010 [bacterium]|nr:hypothetical protein [bacterium]